MNDEKPRARFIVVFALFFSTPSAALMPAPETGDCSLENVAPATIAVVDDDFSLLLDDGRRAAISGLEFPPVDIPDLHAVARKRLADWLVGRNAFFGAFLESADRWGRVPVRVFAATGDGKDAPLVSVGAALLEEGLARFRPDPTAAPCAKAYLVAESPARDRKLGLWSRPETQALDPLGPATRAALLQRKGMIVVEGKIRSVGQAVRAIYLNFSEKKLDDFAVVISRRNLDMFAAAGISPPSLVGRRARVRGLIETGFGPRIEISTPAELELIDGDAAH